MYVAAAPRMTASRSEPTMSPLKIGRARRRSERPRPKTAPPPPPQPIIHIQISPELQKALEKPRGANSPSLRLEGSIDPRGTMTVGLREEGLQAGNCPGCASGRVQDWKSEGEGGSHL